ncbi:MAG: 2,3-bisphosphoglycerate-independent phosphoglycerate mutase [Bdellovibrionales bacterium]|nr:2,3-bisphosphoglycerate-independent phosphoglycerate mutase [Bdellovibrionales bacterium]
MNSTNSKHQLLAHTKRAKPEGPVVMIILDGVGIAPDGPGNALYQTPTTNLFTLINKARRDDLYTELCAHGPAVGLPADNDMGNSEVGHNALGAGQVYDQGAKLVNHSIKNGSLFQSASWKKMVTDKADSDATIHFIGLLSDGNVHSHIDQLFDLLDGCWRDGVKKIRVHPLLDGRDVAPRSALEFITPLNEKLISLQEQEGIDAKIASGGGRMYMTMDRYYSEWSVVERGWHAHVLGKISPDEITENSPGYFKSAQEAIDCARILWPEKQDQFNPPFVIINEDGEPVGPIQDGDTVINFNYRGDRAIQISEAFEHDEFTGFNRVRRPNVDYAGLLEYDGDTKLPKHFLVPPPTIENVLSEYLCAMGIKTFATAETHKFGHVTYFWNGNRSKPIDPELETFVEIPSDPSNMIVLNPEMKAQEVAAELIKAINSEQYQFIRANFANGDMVGHTGDAEAVKSSMLVVDKNLDDVVDITLAKKGVVIITADHGNAEELLDKSGETSTSHSLNPVPFLIIDSEHKDGNYTISLDHLEKKPGLSNVAATLLNLMGYDAPVTLDPSLIKFK